MKYIILLVSFLLLLNLSVTQAQQKNVRHGNRDQLLKELRKCVKPDPDCREESIDSVAKLYNRGDASVLPKLLDVAPKSDDAFAEAIGDFLSQLLCHKPRTFLQAVAIRPKREQSNLLMLAAAADGGGMGCMHMSALRKTLREISKDKTDRLAMLAARCLNQVNKYNPQK